MDALYDVLFWGSVAGLVLVPTLCVAYLTAALFSHHLRARIQAHPTRYIVWSVFSVIFVVAIIYLDNLMVDRVRQSDPTRKLMAAIAQGIFIYKMEHGTFPIDGDNAMIVKFLTGKNPTKEVLITLQPENLNSQGEAVDAWGTPLRIDVVEVPQLMIRSAGKDKEWDTIDDLVEKSTLP